MRPNRFTRCAAWTLAALCAVVLACETLAPDPEPEAAEAEAPAELNGDALMMRDGGADAGWTLLTVTRSDVAYGGETEAGNNAPYLCWSLAECWRKCPKPQRDGWSKGCSCRRVTKNDPWPMTCRVSDIENEGWGGFGNGGGCGGTGTDTIDGGELADCGPELMPVELRCYDARPRHGEKIGCDARPLNPDYDTGDTYYAWTAECYPWGDEGYGDQCTATREGRGNRYKTWRGRATMDAAIRVHISYRPNDSTYLMGVGRVPIQMAPRTGWGTADRLAGTAELQKRSLNPKGGAWKSSEWGRYVFGTYEFPNYSTWSGSGPWEGTKYLSRMPNLRAGDWMYAHPDLYDHGEDYPGAFNLCEDGPGSDFASVYETNEACGTGGLLANWAGTVEAHEKKHMDSHNQCLRSQRMQELIERLGAAAGRDIEGPANDAVADLLGELAVARETNQSGEHTPEGMWYWRQYGKWEDISRTADPHSGTIGC